MSLEVVILAAGEGKRMHSALPKVLHQVAKTPMLLHVLNTANTLNPNKIHIVLGHLKEKVQEAISCFDSKLQEKIEITVQDKQLGTGHALMQVQEKLGDDSKVLVLYGDIPLTKKEDLENLVNDCQDLSILTAICDNPFGYGRIIRDNDGNITGIIEQKDCSDEQKLIKEINTGMICVKGSIAKEYLHKLKNNNAQHEYYLTDLAGLLVHDGKAVTTTTSIDFLHTLGVNNKQQLAFMERLYQQDQVNSLMEQGVSFADPKRFDLRGSLEVGQDVFIDINVIIEGKVKLGNNVQIGAGCILKNCEISDNSILSPYCVIEDSILKKHNTIGPFARLRPGNVLEDEVHIGNFVEVKKSHLGYGTKAGHLSYLGDSDIGKDVNIGAGTITCNYDGANKFKTVIGDDVFVGSDTQLVAPVEIKNGVTIGAGSTITKHIKHDEHALIVTRAQARVLPNYPRPKKNK